ncbi:MAG: diguanylate cyclase [Arcobacter sp.]|uniref:FIST N-terminal domain-containing protein n=1 Tax=uncultured Arcobacter sp. TaxID=165434 RepID=UPI000CB830D0|nr:FIST N-terminal domain-containing protein [uncultured Arcobacter sp.]PLY08599.1 MAG: diguanylate cyclase [Arcobacter sp.]
MNTYNYTYQNNSFKKEIDYSLFKDEKNILIQIFCGQNENTLQYLTNLLVNNLPNAIILGTTTDGEIKDKKVSTFKTVISISIFENTSIKVSMKEGTNSFNSGYEIAKELVTEKTKLIITFTDGTSTNGEDYLKGITAFNEDIMVCGGMAGDNGHFKQTFVSCGKKIISCGAVAVSLNSDTLQVFNDHKYDWSPIGIEHTIDKVKGNRIYEIAGMDAIAFYEKYLGSSDSYTEFPLIVQRNGISVARAVLTRYPDGSFGCGGNLYKGDKIRLGFANAEMIMKNPVKYLKNINNYQAETFFIYSCMARRRYMQSLIKVEIEPFASIAPTSGFFTYAEFFHTNKKNELMNQTITLVGLTENTQHTRDNLIKPNKLVNETESSYAKTIQALTNLIQQSAKDHNEQSKILEEQMKYSQNILKNQKLFLRHAVHETNTPLSVIMSNIELYEMQYGKDEYLSNIEVAMKSIFSIYDDLSYLVKKDQVDYKVYSLDLVDFVRSRVYFFKSVATQVSSKFNLECNCDEMKINFSETKLQRIVDNTLSNAIKYTNNGEDINVKVEKINTFFKFTVSSHSKKIQEPEKIFDEYYREEKSKNGFGLGLNLVKRICDEEGVIINVTSDLDNTSFTYIFKANK